MLAVGYPPERTVRYGRGALRLPADRQVDIVEVSSSNLDRPTPDEVFEREMKVTGSPPAYRQAVLFTTKKLRRTV